MEMTDKEIYRSYNMNGRKYRQIRILAELNDCDCKDIQEVIDRMDNAGKKETAKRGKPKKQEVKAQPMCVIWAVRDRVAKLEKDSVSMQEDINDKQIILDCMLAEWAELKEWQQEYDTDFVKGAEQ